MSNFVPEDILTFDIDPRFREVIYFFFLTKLFIYNIYLNLK